MNFTRCIIYRTPFIGHYFLETNLKFFKRNTFKEVRSVFNNFRREYCQRSSLVKEGNFLPKKRLTKKKKLAPFENEGFRIVAFSTAVEYNLENLSVALPSFTAFNTTSFGSQFTNATDVVHASQLLSQESQDLFFFRDGCVVMWNLSDSEVQTILGLLKNYEDSSFNEDLIKNESEVMSYSISDEVAQTKILRDCLLFSTKADNTLEKYAVSNAMALSVRLGTYEANLEQYVHTMEPVTKDLKSGNKIKMSRNEVLQKTGQLFALRHNINLNSDLLDTPDFYWDRDDLETLYQTIFNYFCISKRTKVINEKINHCIELVELLSSHLNDKHHVRLEWMIIILIMVEVAFEICHYLDRYLESQEN